MFIYTGEVSKSRGWIVEYKGGFWTQISTPPDFFSSPLPELPGKIMPPPMKLQVLFCLKILVAKFRVSVSFMSL
jgi:hypothetical protein